MQPGNSANKKVRRRAKISPLGASPGTLVADPLAKQPVILFDGHLARNMGDRRERHP